MRVEREGVQVEVPGQRLDGCAKPERRGEWVQHGS